MNNLVNPATTLPLGGAGIVQVEIWKGGAGIVQVETWKLTLQQ